MLVSNSSPRTEKAPAYGCPNQNPRHAANELAAQTHWGPRQDCRCGWSSGTLVRGSDTNSPTQEDGRPAGSCRYPADFPKIICTAAREIVVMRRVEFRTEILSPRPCQAVEHGAAGKHQAPARLIQGRARPQRAEGLAHEADGLAHGQQLPDLFFLNEEHV